MALCVRFEVLLIAVIFIGVSLSEDTQGDFYIPENVTTWNSGLKVCAENSNWTMASVNQSALGHSKMLADNISEPLWIFGIFVVGPEVMPVTNKVVIQGKDESSKIRCFCPAGLHGNRLTDCGIKSLAEAIKKCNEKNFTLLQANVSNVFLLMDLLFSDSYISSYWVQDIDVDSLFNATQTNLTIKCLLLDGEGKIKTEDCNRKHKVLCLKGTLKPALVYRNKNYTIPPYKASTTTTTSSPTSSGISASSSYDISTTVTGTGTSKSAVPATPTRSNKVSSDASDPLMDIDVQYTLIGVGVAVVLVIFFVIVCCCICRTNEGEESEEKARPQLSEVYSDAIDSIVLKELEQNKVKVPSSLYAVPADALGKRALQRQSITEGEYDTIPKHKTTKTTGNIYSHVTIGSQNNTNRDSSQMEENAYDVTSYGKQKQVAISSKETPGDTYGHVQINAPS